MVEQIGRTRLVPITRIAANNNANQVFGKLEGDNPAGSVKDRPAANMILRAQERGTIEPGDTLLEATSGNTGIALAMVAATMGYRLKLLMPEAMGERGEGYVLNQFANPDNYDAHYRTTGPELWEATEGKITHFVSSMGTTGTIMGVSRYLKEKNPDIQIIGVQPEDGSSIPGIRRWPEAYLPKIYDPARVDRIIDVSQSDAEHMARRLAREEGILSGVSSGGALLAALSLLPDTQNAVIVTIVCDRGDRYLSSGLFPANN
jgi:cysteine synthase B